MKSAKKLLNDGILPSLLGFDYLVYCIKNYESKSKLTGANGLYNNCAKIFEATEQREEREICIY